MNGVTVMPNYHFCEKPHYRSRKWGYKQMGRTIYAPPILRTMLFCFTFVALLSSGWLRIGFYPIRVAGRVVVF